jgi:type II secretory pathway predicted ATPase ExeA
MDLIYEKYFGFTKAPFNITADPEFLFLSQSHRDALEQIAYALKARRGFLILTGEVGTGKTTLIHSLLSQLDDMTRTAFICSHIGSPLNLLQYTCDQLRIKVPRYSRTDSHEHLDFLNDFLAERYRKGENSVLIIDEAQNLSVKVLESVRMLSNFETTKDKLLQILLVGQPELTNRLNAQELRQLKQRVTLRCDLRPLTLKECGGYVASRLQVGGGDPELFTRSALALVYQYSGGIPRIINVVCDNSLLLGYRYKKPFIDDAIVRQAAEDLNLSSEWKNDWQSQPNSLPQLDAANPSGNETNSGSVEEPRPIREITTVDKPSRVPLPNPNALLGFFDQFTEGLQEVMGPMARIVLQDHVRRTGYSMESFPQEKLEELVQAVSEEILDPYMRTEFRKAVDHSIFALRGTSFSKHRRSHFA